MELAMIIFLLVAKIIAMARFMIRNYRFQFQNFTSASPAIPL